MQAIKAVEKSKARKSNFCLEKLIALTLTLRQIDAMQFQDLTRYSVCTQFITPKALLSLQHSVPRTLFFQRESYGMQIDYIFHVTAQTKLFLCRKALIFVG